MQLENLPKQSRTKANQSAELRGVVQQAVWSCWLINATSSSRNFTHSDWKKAQQLQFPVCHCSSMFCSLQDRKNKQWELHKNKGYGGWFWLLQLILSKFDRSLPHCSNCSQILRTSVVVLERKRDKMSQLFLAMLPTSERSKTASLIAHKCVEKPVGTLNGCIHSHKQG